LQKAVHARPDVVQRALADEQVVQDQAQRQLNRNIAAESIVLLKNDRQTLPLRPDIKTLAVVGPNAQQRTVSGGGSAYLLSSYVVTPLEGLTAAAKARGIAVEHAPGCYGEPAAYSADFRSQVPSDARRLDDC
jgi:beta-glucosidase-like glycosyl hydrolase